jgi:hypothetical protein
MKFACKKALIQLVSVDNNKKMEDEDSVKK